MNAIFNAPVDLLNHSKIAVECAFDIIENMSILNIELQEEGLPPISIGIGINTGDAVIGNMGSEFRFDYTAIGDAVNTAARLESSTKERNVLNTQFFWQGSLEETGLFGQQLFKSGKYITLTEGECDAMATYELLGSKWAVVSIKRGAAGAVKDVKSSFEFLDGFD